MILKKQIVNILQNSINFIREIYEKRYLVYELSKRDFKQRYIGSYLGLIWAFLEPLTLMLIMWFVFSFGFRAHTSGDVPYVAYLFTGFIAFNFFQDAIGANSNVIRSYAFLVRKGNFRLSILPIVKINSALILHIVFVLIVMCVLWMVGIFPSIYWPQFIYYLSANIFLILGLGWLTSALGVFIRDISHIITIILRFAFWLTPIFWNPNIIPERYRIFLQINPICYIVQGYRDSFIYHIPFWEYPSYTFYFWAFSFIMFVLGIIIFRRLRPHFADVIN